MPLSSCPFAYPGEWFQDHVRKSSSDAKFLLFLLQNDIVSASNSHTLSLHVRTIFWFLCTLSTAPTCCFLCVDSAQQIPVLLFGTFWIFFLSVFRLSTSVWNLQIQRANCLHMYISQHGATEFRNYSGGFEDHSLP